MNQATQLNAYELSMIQAGLRALKNNNIDIANGLDRAFGPNDGRAKEAWTDAQAKNAEVDKLAAKLGIKL